MANIIKTKISWFFILLTFVIGSITACKNSSYPCPKDNNKRAAKLSEQEDDGAAPATGNRGKSSKKNNGLVKKKQPKRIHKR